MYGVEPICRVLTEHGIKIAPSTYYEARDRAPSKRALRDAEIIALIADAREHRFRARFGARKMWLHLRSSGHDVARCTVERLMAAQGWTGALRGKQPRTTTPAENDASRRIWSTGTSPRPPQTSCGWPTSPTSQAGPGRSTWRSSSTSSPRRIVGWRAATQMTTDLVLDTLEMAIWSRRREGIEDLTGLVHHTDYAEPCVKPRNP